MSSLPDQIHHIGKNARDASRALARLDSKTKNAVLIAMADELIVRLPDILEANAADVASSAIGPSPTASISKKSAPPSASSGSSTNPARM